MKLRVRLHGRFLAAVVVAGDFAAGCSEWGSGSGATQTPLGETDLLVRFEGGPSAAAEEALDTTSATITSTIDHQLGSTRCRCPTATATR